MARDEQLETAKTAIEATREVASTFNEWAKEATEIAEAGKELSEIQGVLKGMTAFGKASFVLGLAAGDIEMVLKLTGGPTPEERIMGMISELSDKVDRLEIHLDYVLKRSEDERKKDDAGAEIRTNLFHILNVKDDLNAYRTECSPEIKQKLAHDMVRQYDKPLDLRHDVLEMARLLSSRDASQNVLLAVYNQTDGSAREVASLGMSLLMTAIYASTAYSIIAALRQAEDDNEKLALPKEVEHLFSEPIIRIRQAVDKHVSDCFKNTDQNIVKHIAGGEIFKSFDLDHYTTLQLQ